MAELNSITAMEVYNDRKVKLAISGMLCAWLSSVTAVIQATINGIATGTLFVDLSLGDNAGIVIVSASAVLASCDLVASIWAFLYNVITGRSVKEYKRHVKFKPAWGMCIGALVAGPFATACWQAANNLCGITYATVIVAMTPIVTVIFGRLFLKESVSARVYFGIIISIVGCIIAQWAPPENAPYFVIGIIVAALAPIGFTAESLLGAYATDLCDPLVGSGFFRCLISGIGGCCVMTITSTILLGSPLLAWRMLGEMFTNPTIIPWLIATGLMTAISYGTVYVAFNRCGPSRTMALVYTMPVWTIPVAMVFEAMGLYEYSVTTMGVVGALIVVVGIIVVVAKPSELVNLRDVE